MYFYSLSVLISASLCLQHATARVAHLSGVNIDYVPSTGDTGDSTRSGDAAAQRYRDDFPPTRSRCSNIHARDIEANI